jgi:hypothetical protein
MRIALLVMLIGASGTAWAEDAFGVWRVTPIRSAAPYSDLVTVRFAPHAKGEVFTLDRIDADGHATTSSTILYFDGKPRDLQDVGCAGTQSSRRVDSQTVEIVRTCADGQRISFVRRSAGPKQLVLEINAQQPNGRSLERRLVLRKQVGQVVLH